MKFNEILHTLRVNKGLTMKAVAEAVGAKPDTYRNYETGKFQPNFEVLSKLAEFYGVSTDYLLGRDDKSVTTQAELEHQILEAYYKLDPEDRAQVLEVMLAKIAEYKPDILHSETILMEVPEPLRDSIKCDLESRLKKRAEFEARQRKQSTLKEIEDQQTLDEEAESRAKKDA